jgi:sugar lactone lactonase YvrE
MLAFTFPSVLRLVVIIAFLAGGASAAMAHPPWGIVVSSTGIVYFSDLETIWKIDSAGNVSVFRASVGGRHVHELAIDAQDNLYGPDYIYEPRSQKYLIGAWKMTPDGKETYLQRPIDSVMSGVSIWRDRAGNMYSIEQNNHTRERTLLLRRTPGGIVSTLTGGPYGHKDGKGAAVRFGSVSAMTLAPDGNIYLTDALSVRRVSLDGTVTTLATNLAARTSEDKPTLFGGIDTIIIGLAVDHDGHIYVADAGNRRLLKIGSDERVSVIYRCDPPFFPTGVFATPSGDVYVLEFSYTPPGTTNNPRVRKISSDGQNRIVASTGVIRTGVVVAPPSEVIHSRFKSLLAVVNTRLTYVVLLVLAGVVTVTFGVWRISRKQRI